MEKAYDHMCWKFLEDTMLQMGFGRKWCNWVKVCISSASFSLLINGTSEDFFQNSRGLRQGCPLSSPLFNIVMEMMCRLVWRAESIGALNGYKVGEFGLSVAFIQYADDSLFFL